MYTFAIVATKGGTGKTTLACNLAVAFETAQLGSAAIVDVDPQQSAHQWSQSRNRTPYVVAADPKTVRRAKAAAESINADLLFVDTPPHTNAAALAALQIADAAIMPVRPALFDLLAVSTTIKLCSSARIPLVAVVTNAPPRGPLAQEAVETLSSLCRVSPVQIVQRAAYVHAQPKGLGVTELKSRARKAAVEIEALLQDLLDNHR